VYISHRIDLIFFGHLKKIWSTTEKKTGGVPLSSSASLYPGTVKGELAGMVVAPDPYAFDDEMDDASLTPTGLTSSGITLKKGATFQHPPTASPNPPWPHPVPSHLSNSLADCVVVKSVSGFAHSTPWSDTALALTSLTVSSELVHLNSCQDIEAMNKQLLVVNP